MTAGMYMKANFSHLHTSRRTVAYILSAIILCQCSCNKESPDKEFIENDSICLMMNGKAIITYDEDNYQISSNSDQKVFRVMDDNMGKYYQLSCSDIPYSEGQNIKADLKWATGTSVSTREGLQFKVEKVTSEGKVWMWCKSRKIGVSIQVVL